jgi:hypothetical protein
MDMHGLGTSSLSSQTIITQAQLNYRYRYKPTNANIGGGSQSFHCQEFRKIPVPPGYRPVSPLGNRAPPEVKKSVENFPPLAEKNTKHAEKRNPTLSDQSGSRIQGSRKKKGKKSDVVGVGYVDPCAQTVM